MFTPVKPRRGLGNALNPLQLVGVDAPLPTPATPESLAMIATWTVGGWPTEVLIWTAAAWARLAQKPADTQPLPDGSWVALRVA